MGNLKLIITFDAYKNYIRINETFEDKNQIFIFYILVLDLN